MTTLIVDLDGTILRSDMLLETFWSAFSKDLRTPMRAGAALLKGKAVLKRYLADASSVDVTSLPYDEDVLAYVRNWREGGGKVVLVTATDQKLAQEIASYLGIFDGVHGSDGETNLKSENKAAFIRERYGDFAYIGDSSADIPVWSAATKAITVNASTTLQQAARQAAPETEHLHSSSPSLRPYIKALRPHQWLKNCLIFLPILVAHQITQATFLQGLLAFVAFSLIASSVYVINDLLDLRADRAHPRKCKRPFASGLIPLAHAPLMFGGLLLLGLLVALSLGTDFLLVMLGYYALTLAYSLSLKRRAIVDICALAGLYTLRVIAGGAATGIALSIWLLAFSIFLFFSLACVKRQAELVLNSAKTGQKIEGRGYQTEDREIISMMAMSSGYISVLVLALYLNSDAVKQLYAQPFYLWGTCCVLLYWVSRNVLLAHRGHMHDDPVIFAIKDRVSLLCGALILGFALAGILL
jgi:4-hydroxybenzoate polyprenyltransferase/phosphoserine phosphatase